MSSSSATEATEIVPRSKSATADRLLVAACVAALALLLTAILTFGYGRDQGIYAMVGRSILAGGMPYRDAWDFKPPGVFLIYAFSRAIFGSGQAGIRVLEVAGLTAMIAAMVRITEQWWGDRRIGLFAGVLSVLVHAQLDFWHTAQPESFGGIVTIFALFVLGPTMVDGSPERLGAAPGREALRRWALSGALFGFAGLLKPPLAGGGAVIAMVFALPVLRARGWNFAGLRAALVPPAVIAAGGALPFVLCLVWFLARGAFADLVDVLFVFTPHYTKLSWVDATLIGMVYDGFNDWLMTYSSAVTIGFLSALALGPTKREVHGALTIGAIIAVHLAGVVMQAKFFPYHFGATWPLTAMIAAIGFVRLWERLAKRGPVGIVGFFALCALSTIFRTATKDLEHPFFTRLRERVAIFGRFSRDQAAIDHLASVADVNAGKNREVAALLHARVPEGRSIFVWGFEPVIYDLADRAPATRYLYDVPQRVAWAKGQHRAALMRDLTASRPAAIVVERRDVFPMVTGDAIDSADTLKGFAELRDLIATRFTLAATIEDFEVYLER